MHKDYCGGKCGGETKCKECWLNEAFPCDASCENMLPDGSPDIEKCKAIGCDAIKWGGANEVIIVSSVEEAVYKLQQQYAVGEYSMCDYLASTEIHGLSVEDVVIVFARLMKWSDDDVLIAVKDGEAFTFN